MHSNRKRQVEIHLKVMNKIDRKLSQRKLE